MKHRSRSVLIHPSFRADALYGRRVASLRTSAIDPAFHYLGVRQADLWLKVHQRHAPGSVDPNLNDIYRNLAADLSHALAGRHVHLIGLGAGGGEKEAMILQALSRASCRLRYTPADISPELALSSAEAAETLVDCPIFPVVGDLSMLSDTRDWLGADDGEEVRVYTAFGITPNFSPSTLFALLADALRPQDHLLISANLAPVLDDDDADYRRACRSLISQYDNVETRVWLRQVLIDWGIAPRLSEPAFELGVMEGITGFFAISHWLAETRFDFDGEEFSAAQGEPLRLFFSLRYTDRRLREKVAEHGLSLGRGYVTATGQEGVYPARRAPATPRSRQPRSSRTAPR